MWATIGYAEKLASLFRQKICFCLLHLRVSLESSLISVSNIKNTLLYVQLEEALFQGEQDYISKVAKTEKDICALIEAGFEYVAKFEGARIFRKRKL